MLTQTKEKPRWVTETFYDYFRSYGVSNKSSNARTHTHAHAHAHAHTHKHTHTALKLV